MDGLTDGMLEIRHHSATRSAYDAIHGGGGIHQPQRQARWLLDLMAARPGMRLLDVACGEGLLPRLAAARGLEAHGVDFSGVALRRGSSSVGPLQLAVADGQELPYIDASFDRVVSIGSLEHYADPGRGAAELARVLAPDGLAVVLLPNSFGLRWNVLYAWRHGEIQDDGQPIQRYGTRRQWLRLLRAGGLEIVRIVGYEGELAGPRSWLGAVRHPSRLLIPLVRWLPVDMASMFVFLGRRARDG